MHDGCCNARGFRSSKHSSSSYPGIAPGRDEQGAVLSPRGMAEGVAAPAFAHNFSGGSTTGFGQAPFFILATIVSLAGLAVGIDYQGIDAIADQVVIVSTPLSDG